MVKAGTMKHTKSLVRHRRTSLTERAVLLQAFERSGLSAAAFARQHGLGYSTFYHWRRQARTATAPAFVEVELPSAPVTEDLLIELGPAPRLRLTSAHQVALAAQLLQALQAPTPC
jgi:transposase-like protein